MKGRFKRAAFAANINVDDKHLEQIKKKVFNWPFRKRGYGMWPMKNGVKMEKDIGSTKSLERKWRLFFWLSLTEL